VAYECRTGFPVKKMRQRLLEEGINVSRKSPHFLLKKYNELNSVADHKRAPRRKLLGSEHIRFMDEAKETNPEITYRQLHGMLTEKFLNVRVSNK